MGCSPSKTVPEAMATASAAKGSAPPSPQKQQLQQSRDAPVALVAAQLKPATATAAVDMSAVASKEQGRAEDVRGTFVLAGTAAVAAAGAAPCCISTRLHHHLRTSRASSPCSSSEAFSAYACPCSRSGCVQERR